VAPQAQLYSCRTGAAGAEYKGPGAGRAYRPAGGREPIVFDADERAAEAGDLPPVTGGRVFTERYFNRVADTSLDDGAVVLFG
jgi:hypothetical protein